MGLTVVALNNARRWGWLHDVWIAADVATESQVEVGDVEDSERVPPLVVCEGREGSRRRVNVISGRRKGERRLRRSSKITRSDGVIRVGRGRELEGKRKISQSDSVINTITARRRGWARKIVRWLLLERLRSRVAVVNCLYQQRSWGRAGRRRGG